MRILGIDPGSISAGYGVVERHGPQTVHVAHGTLRPPRGGALPARLAFLHAEIARIVASYRPDLVAIELVFAGKSARSALVLGQARGAALVALASAGVPIREISPQHVKLAVTGDGAAQKAQVQAMVQRLLRLAELPARDAADALAAALCCAAEGRLGALDLRRRVRRGGVSSLRAATSRLVVRRVP